MLDDEDVRAILRSFVLLLIMAIVFCAAMCAHRGPAVAAAQDVEDPPTPPANVDEIKSEAHELAALYAHEHGLPREYHHGVHRGFLLDDDMSAIDSVIERVRRARERSDRTGHDASYHGAVNAYTRGRLFMVEHCTGIFFDSDGSEPACWAAANPTVPWENRREAWMVTLRHAIDVRLGLVHDRCEMPPLHWGCGPAQTARGCRDHLRAESAGWIEISCGITHNTFYAAVPGC